MTVRLLAPAALILGLSTLPARAQSPDSIPIPDFQEELLFDQSMLDEEEGNVQSIGALVGAGDNIYFSAASYDFSAMSFRIRGYDSQYTDVYINGMLMNDPVRGRFNYSSMGGLNRAFRNRTNSIGLEAASYGFGDIGGSANISTIASGYAPGINATFMGNAYVNLTPVGHEALSNLWTLYPDEATLAGKYNGLFQIGECQAYGTGYETAQMSGDDFFRRSALNGLPQPGKLDTVVTSLRRIKEWGRSQDSIARYVGQLIRLDDVAFEGGGSLTWSDFGASSNRSLIDGLGNSITVRNSAYATFSQMTMPAGTGSVVAILSYYGTDWQLLMRSQTDAFGFSGDPADIPGAKPARYRLSSAMAAAGTRFIMVADGSKVVIPIAASYSYGDLYVEDPVAADGDMFTLRSTPTFPHLRR